MLCVVRVGCRGGGDTSNSKAQLRNTQQHTALKHTHTFFLFVVFSVGGYKGCFFGWRFWGVSGSDIEECFGGGTEGWFFSRGGERVVWGQNRVVGVSRIVLWRRWL